MRYLNRVRKVASLFIVCKRILFIHVKFVTLVKRDVTSSYRLFQWIKVKHANVS